mgnify:CR=1 FL=1
MPEETFEEFIKFSYPFLNCGKGCWKNGDDEIVAISTMTPSHIEHCIEMLENWTLTEDHQHREKAEELLNDKIWELREAL